MYQCQLKLFTQYNQPFGDPIWLLLSVEEGGVLGITQQLNSISGFNHVNKKINQNPFSAFNVNANNNTLASVSSINPATKRMGKSISPDLDEEKRPDFYDDMFS